MTSEAATATSNNIGGYDNSFITGPPVDRLVCKICHIPSRDPYLSVCCGHLFCKSCLDNATAITKICPMCRNEEFYAFPNKAIEREVRALHIYCTNKEKGCEWQGELNDISNHLGNSDGCQFEEVQCSNECGKMIERRYLTSHVETECPHRKVSCQYCQGAGKHQFIEGQHKEECPKLPLSCPNKCGAESILREDMEAHRKKECPLEVIQCEYHSVGCQCIKLVHKDQEKHNQQNMKEHLMMTKNELISNRAHLADTKDQLNDVKAQLDDTKTQLDIALKQINSLTVLMSTQLHPIIRSTNLRSLQLDVMATMFKSVCPVTIKFSEVDKRRDIKIQ